jgi:uncharacterized phage protein gp47/JayE
MLTLEQLDTEITEDEALDEVLEILRQLGFQTTAWQTGSVQLTMLRAFARMYVKLTGYIRGNVRSGFTGLAKEAFLTLLAKYVYLRERIAASPTIGTMVLTSSAGAPVHSWGANEIIIANDEEGADGAISYTILEAGSINPGTSIEVEVQANIAGELGNIAPDTTLYLWTPLVGVEATNPALDLSNTWVTTPGADEESDARLQTRCDARWDHLAYGNTDGAYRGWALEALPALTRVAVRGAPGDGTVTLVGATALGGLTGGQITTIEEYIYGVTDGVGRRPINDIVSMESAVEKTDSPVTMTVYVLSQYRTGMAAAIEADLLTLFGSIPIGGVKLTTPSVGYVLYDDIINAAKNKPDDVYGTVPRPGVRSVALSAPTGNVALAVDEIYVPTITVNIVEVS